MITFVDTSALAKRYLHEVGSSWTVSWILPSDEDQIVISELTEVEMISLLSRRQREGSLTETDVDRLEAIFLLHIEVEYLSIPIDANVVTYARNCVRRHKLRALDAIQLGSAMSARDEFQENLTFISADNNLLTAAAAEGFVVDNPLNHP